MRVATALLLGVFAFGGIGFASDVSGVQVHHDGYFLKDGKVMAFRLGNVSELKAEVIVGDGIRLLPDGTLIAKDGTKSRIGDDQFVAFEGRSYTRENKPMDAAHDRYGAASEMPRENVSATHTEVYPKTYSADQNSYQTHGSDDESHWINHSVRFGQNDDNRSYDDPR